MGFGIITLPLVPGRHEPSDKSEMVTQFTFGVHYKVLDQKEKWVLIESAVDQYQCWIDKKQHTEIEVAEFTKISNSEHIIVSNASGLLRSALGDHMQIPMGSMLPNINRENELSLASKRFTYEGELKNVNLGTIGEIGQKLLHAPYLWGGKSIMGIDCSGFTQIVFRCCGHSIPRDAYQQAEIGETIDFIDLAKCGDLVFFDNEEGKITHVGMILTPSKIIHASGSVRIDTIDHQGIFHKEIGKYTHKTRIIKRIIAEQ